MACACEKNKSDAHEVNRMTSINQQRTIFMSLSPEEQLQYVNEALKDRQAAKARKAPVERSLDAELATEVFAGPWSMSASKDGRPGDWPLNRCLLNDIIGKRNIASVAESWNCDNCKVWDDAPDFPDTIELQEACKVDECLHVLTPMQTHRFERICEEFRLALRHNVLLAHCPLLF